MIFTSSLSLFSLQIGYFVFLPLHFLLVLVAQSQPLLPLLLLLVLLLLRLLLRPLLFLLLRLPEELVAVQLLHRDQQAACNLRPCRFGLMHDDLFAQLDLGQLLLDADAHPLGVDAEI